MYATVLKFSYYFGLGDNIHTAISVARDCDMIEAGHKVIVLQATSNGDQGVSLDYSIVGEDVSCATDTINVITDSYSSEFNNSISLKVKYKHVATVYTYASMSSAMILRLNIASELPSILGKCSAGTIKSV